MAEETTTATEETKATTTDTQTTTTADTTDTTTTADTTADATSTDTTTTTDTTTDTTADVDWRKAIAGEDPEALKQLERFTDPKALLKSYNEAQKAIREGGKVKIPGKDATAEEISAYNKARGVPDKAEDYKITVKPPADYEVTADDKANIALMTAKLHASGADPVAVNAAVESYYAMAEAALENSLERGAMLVAETEARLKKEWPGKGRYDENIAWANAAVSQFGLEKLKDVQLAGGGYVGDHLEFIKSMAMIGRENAEDPFFLKAANASTASDPEARKSEIMALRNTDQKRYNSPEIQAELDAINTAILRRRERAA